MRCAGAVLASVRLRSNVKAGCWRRRPIRNAVCRCLNVLNNGARAMDETPTLRLLSEIEHKLDRLDEEVRDIKERRLSRKRRPHSPPA